MRWAPVLLVALLAGCTSMEPAIIESPPSFPADPVYSPRHPFTDGPIDLGRPIAPPPPAPREPVTLTFAASVARSIVYNGGFEEGEAAGEPAGWSLAGPAARDEAHAQEGAFSLRLGQDGSASQIVGGIQPAASATARFHHRGEGTIHVVLAALDAQRRPLAAREIAVATSRDGWGEAALGPLALPGDAAHLRIVFRTSDPADAIVDAVVVEVARPVASPFEDGGFEARSPAWRLAGSAAIDCGFSFAQEGSCALRLARGSSLQSSAAQTFGAQTGTLSVSFTHATQLSPPAERRLVVQLAFADAAGQPLGEVREELMLAEEGWVVASVGASAIPASAATVELALSAGGMGAGPTWVDDVRVAWS